MKNNLIIVIIINLTLLFMKISKIFGSRSIGNFSHPDYPGKCYIAADKIYEPGIYQMDNECIQQICSDNGQMTYHSCGTKIINGCKRGDYVPNNLPYPECCKYHFYCIDQNGYEYRIIS